MTKNRMINNLFFYFAIILDGLFVKVVLCLQRIALKMISQRYTPNCHVQLMESALPNFQDFDKFLKSFWNSNIPKQSTNVQTPVVSKLPYIPSIIISGSQLPLEDLVAARTYNHRCSNDANSKSDCCIENKTTQNELRRDIHQIANGKILHGNMIF